MKMVKSLLLGAAAGIVAVAGAQAADLPVKAKPVEYVKICTLYGAGFYYVPGTDTCIKFGGYVRVQIDLDAGSGVVDGRGTGSQADQARFTRDLTNDINYRNRMAFDVDARTQTDYGTLRSYIRAGWENSDARATGRRHGHVRSGIAPSSSSPASRSVVRSRSSTSSAFGGAYSYLNVRTIGDTGATGRTSGPTRSSSATACPTRCRWKIRPPATAAFAMRRQRVGQTTPA